MSIDKPALEMPLEDWNRVVDVNLTGVWLCSRTACRLMQMKNVRGKIINIASTYGRQADLEPSAPYYATKAAIINLTRALAVEWASHGINVNAIAPGYFPTRMTRIVDENPEIKRRFLSRIILKRAGDPTRDLAGALIFLASNASDYMTGQTIFVDGGWTAT
jgi:NAD(P)-dependent dehydrogenase (short-subunit alcohol dehydrogenase family)